MATYYTGYRNVLRGRDADNFINTYTGDVGTYSNWSLMDTGDKLLAGMPDNEYVLGTYKHALLLEYLFSGGQHVAPINNVGGGARLVGFRFNPTIYRGLPGAAATYNLGHAANRGSSYSQYSNYVYDGLTVANPLASVGHALRYGVSYGGASKPLEYQGVPTAPLSDVGHAILAGYTTEYGRQKPMEWRGAPASRALP